MQGKSVCVWVAAVLLAGQVQAGTPEQVERGRYLVEITGCDDCHTPLVMGPEGPRPDTSRRLSGHPGGEMPPPPALGGGAWAWLGAGSNTAFAGPWGISYATNLTPDGDTGMGQWREEDFVQALTTGRHMGVSRPILPPMPWTAYRHMTPEDLRSMYAFLRTVPAVKNQVPAAVIAAP